MKNDWPELFVLRHGQTEWNAAGRHQGRLDSPLTETGLAQAAAQGRLLRDAGLADRGVRAFASPQGRAWRTAEIALAAVGLTPVADDRLMEVGFGAWEGKTRAEIEAGWPWSDDIQDLMEWTFSAPGGESYDAMCARLRAFLDDLDGPAVIVAHGITSRVLRGLWLGLDLPQLADLPGGQGVVYHLKGGEQVRLG
ncbi:Phosphoglycerate mutase family 4 [Candidatus Rhodobacter oscarellae]|uniref:Phosphoglycerate mutase family 4 n=1 Tax=Candidatus Rhodobacter oscarellae TaxID=1675527 RepID=A0A0J9E0D5_9RHOB|nr:histidine phosphatase family protein [Candidatus Rhodobacter lobularis]KMW56401.1 Phosphoglycerate mutase family 4 [Candidatus Rhodobacter lobularis]